MRVKGTLIVEYVKVVRAARDKNWDEWLDPEDWKFINKTILASSWYPYRFFRSISHAVFRVAGDSDLSEARRFARFTLRNQLRTYRRIIVPGNPVESVQKLAALRRTFFDSQGHIDILVVEHGKDWLRYKFIVPKDEEDLEAIESMGHYAAGFVEEAIEQAGEKVKDFSFERKKYGCEVLFSW